jgi:hypothetical protein
MQKMKPPSKIGMVLRKEGMGVYEVNVGSVGIAVYFLMGRVVGMRMLAWLLFAEVI